MKQFLLQLITSIKANKLHIGLFAFIFSGLNAFTGAQTIDHWETALYSDNTFYYHTNNEGDVPSDWRDPGFDASSWKQGPGGIGYGDDDDKTVIEQCISVFMRTSLYISDTSTIAAAVLHMDYDDAFVAYLNGVEIARSEGLSGEYPAPTQLSSVNHEAKMYSGGVPEAFGINTELLKQLLKPGNNVLAIQVHNTSTSSSDMSSITFFSVGLTTSEEQYGPLPDWFYLPWVFEGSTLPLMIIDTDGQTIPDEPKITAKMKLINNGNGMINHPDDPANEYDGFIGIEIRGASSSGYPQKPYALETRDSLGENLNVPLLGLPKENDWVLLSHYNEKTFMRNPLSFYVFNKMGHYSVRTRLVDVVINGKYEGIYLFGEKVKRDKNRVDIKKLTPDEISDIDLTGGYIFKTDYANSYDSWVSDYSPVDHPDYETRFVYYYPKWDVIADEQKVYIKEAVDAFQAAMHQDNFADTYADYIDVTSFIDYFLISEVSRNIDGYKKSRYYYKDRDDINNLFFAGPVWDFDWAWKNIYDCAETRNTYGAGWSYKTNDCIRTYMPGWYVRLLQDDNFANMVHCRYKKLRKTVLSLDSIYAFMDSIYNVVKEPQVNHYKRWDILGVRTGAPEMESPAQTYDEEVQRLKDWIAIRLGWLDSNMVGSGEDCDATAINDKENAKMRVFPNPASTHVYIEAVKVIEKIEIVDVSGKTERSFYNGGTYSWKLNISDLPKGLHFIKAFIEGKGIVVKKLLIV
jgi:hypothetical protein